ncbi:hypothetical protein [Sphingosinicella sp. LY1275]|uniref:ATP-grasp domain-containing protein n=1 Tax=Sphingosinicella sp. LY1275 TaxID=3095379 RepID=UPI002ADEC6DA|nr:hypothetical protein [Sphingosinicella sp. LY1275]MEA1013076.1 hypothetical protein [Sphingosinicella sp. LY1275]
MAQGRIGILTPDAESDGYSTRWPDVLARLAAPLRGAGLEVEGRNWTEPDLSGFDLVLPLLAWGYHHGNGRWAERVEDWQAAGLALRNPPSVLRWNADKTYLARLEAKGAPIVPTLYADRLTEAALREASARFGTDRLVAKPQVSAGAWQTIRWSPGTAFDDGPSGPAMIQPYLRSIETEGEVSLLYFAGRFSHAISKRPQPGDFRVQPEYDGIIARYDPAPDERAAAEAALAAVDEDLLYARVDLVRGLDGRPALMELELVEPDLYLGYDPEQGAAFAAAVRAAIA